jgi:site-specific DNA-methyltransferase (adenine-specific)
MSKFSESRFVSSKQDWPTPSSLYEPLDKEFKFTLDAAASKSNTKTKRYFSEKEDGLAQSWGVSTVWVNPPYGDAKRPISSWVLKGYEESLSGATVVLLIPARTNTNWFHDIVLAKGEVRFIRGRPKFGDSPHGLPQPLCLVIFRAKRKRAVK